MTTYRLDTNVCTTLINGKEPRVRRRFQQAVDRDKPVLLSSIVAFELWYGVAKSQRKESNTARMDAFLAGPFEWASWATKSTLPGKDSLRFSGTDWCALRPSRILSSTERRR